MELTKTKYKKTELGIIPEDWEIKSVGDLMGFKNGLNKESKYFGYGTPIVNYMDVFKHHGLRKTNVEGKVFVSFQEQMNFSAKEGDMFFTRTSETQEEIGISAVLLEDIPNCVFSGFILRGRAKNTILCKEYKQYCFTPSYIRKQIISKSSYTTRALTNGRYLSLVKIAIPPTLEEQKAIATVLTDIDDLITNLEKLIAKKKAIKTGSMQQLLTGKIRTKRSGDNKKFKKSKVGRIPEDWETIKIGSIADVYSGGTPNTNTPSYWGGQIKWMSSGELNLKYVYDVENRITEEGLKNSSTKEIPKECVLVGLAGQGKTRGTVAINFVELCTNQSIASILPSAKYISKFLYYYLDSQYLELRKLSTGDGGRGGLNLSIIKNIFIPFPKPEEQKAIAEILTDMDSEIIDLESKKEKYQDIKQGMIQELLTGKTRLI
jgi:type I restriction enzyme S subunit